MWNMTVKQVKTGRTWDEPLSVLDKNYRSKPLPKRTSKAEAHRFASDTVDYFNATLKEGESPRELVGVFFQDETEIKSYY